jgi:hypothetical protein
VAARVEAEQPHARLWAEKPRRLAQVTAEAVLKNERRPVAEVDEVELQVARHERGRAAGWD